MNEDYFTSFHCQNCHTAIEASPDMIGSEAECPACGTRFVVPDNRVADDIKRQSADENDPNLLRAIKSRTIRIELGDDL